MSNSHFLERHQVIPAFVPVADAFAGGITTDYISLENFSEATLFVFTGAVEDAAVSNLVTIAASDDNAGGVTTDMAFRYSIQKYSSTVDSWSSIVLSATTGFNFSDPNSDANTVWYATVTAAEVSSAQAGAQFIAATIAETVNKTITACGVWILSNPRYPQALPVGVLS